METEQKETLLCLDCLPQAGFLSSGIKEFSMLSPGVPSLHSRFIGDDNFEQGDAVSSQ